ncbi:MAG: DUF4390 domain-containing protein [Smithellaceae bacterium]|nr:DUF4390 domain-containing protein [Syntrophaceae bacterium]MDD4241950.1 DUF4390 domain-containing protein [Smithellaceae bacterium]NLX53025.1 DUF4390 domain-containing protein [Deltaproteobacteria bacterium]
MKNRFVFWRRAFCVVLFVAVAAVSAPVAARADINPRMVDLLITSNTQNVLLYARLVDCFKKEMESAILAGVPAVFTLHLDVYRERSYVWDKHIVGKEIKRTIKYDNLKKTFSITTNGMTQPVVLPDFESAQKAMADLSGIIVIPISSLVRGNNYYVEVRVKMDKVRLPFSMEYVLFFVSLWDFETPLYKMRFSH